MINPDAKLVPETKKQQNNFAFIDGQNLHLGVRDLGWKLDYQRFRVYLADKYHVTRAYYFLGYMPENQILYKSFQILLEMEHNLFLK